jgi:hypothetical protein
MDLRWTVAEKQMHLVVLDGLLAAQIVGAGGWRTVSQVRKRQVWLDPNEFNEISMAFACAETAKWLFFFFFFLQNSTKRRENLSLFSTGTVRKGKENLRTTFFFSQKKRKRKKRQIKRIIIIINK